MVWNRYNFLLGLVWGLLLAASYTALLLVLLLIGSLLGQDWRSQAPPGMPALPVPNLLAAYLLGGITAGVVMGVLFRSGQGAFRSVIVGFASVIPFLIAIRIAIEGLGGWGVGDLLQIVVRALAMGGLLGVCLWALGWPFWRKDPEAENVR